MQSERQPRYATSSNGIAIPVANTIASLDLSPFFGRTMIVGVLLLAAPAIVGFYLSVAGRSLVGRRFDLADMPAVRPHS